jgi:hypothetical protein
MVSGSTGARSRDCRAALGARRDQDHAAEAASRGTPAEAVGGLQ